MVRPDSLQIAPHQERETLNALQVSDISYDADGRPSYLTLWDELGQTATLTDADQIEGLYQALAVVTGRAKYVEAA